MLPLKHLEHRRAHVKRRGNKIARMGQLATRNDPIYSEFAVDMIYDSLSN
jgi:hypothetical protein